MRSLEWAPLWVIFNMTDVLIRGGHWDTDTQEGRPSQDSEKMTVSTPGSQSSRETSAPEVWVLNSIPQTVCCLSLAVCDTLWWQPWKTNVVTVISQIISQNEMFLKCFKMFSDLNMDEYILLLSEKIRCETASIHHHFWCSYRTPDRWDENRNLNLDLFMFYSCDNISIAKFKKLIKNGTVGGNIL